MITIPPEKKAEDLAYRRKVSKTGGGAPPPQPMFTVDEEIARALMSQDLAMPSQAKEFDQLHPLDEEGNLVLDVIISKIYLSRRVTYVYKNCWLICYTRLRL